LQADQRRDKRKIG
jgi:hypothetical protein